MLKIALAQINSKVGDLAGNAEKIFLAAQQAQQAGASLLVTPELSLTGYPQRIWSFDLLFSLPARRHFKVLQTV